MLTAVCPIDGTIHHADEEHAGKLLRCGKCGRPVRIGFEAGAANRSLEKPYRNAGSIDSRIDGRRSPHSSRISSKLWYLAGLTAALALIGIYMLAIRPGVPPGPPEHSSERIDKHDPSRQNGSTESTLKGDRLEVTKPASGITDIDNRGRTLKSGTKIRPDIGIEGRGILTIDNLNGEDAEVKVISDSNGVQVRDLFVQKGTKVTCKRLSQGTYSVRFAIGQDWDQSARRFTRSQSFFQFGESLVFNESQRADLVEYSEHDITLYVTPDGNVRRRVITQQEFDRN